MNVILLFVAGAILIAAEVLLPGAIAGIIGGCLLLAGVVYSFIHYGADQGWMAAIGSVLFVGAALWIEFWLLPRTRWGRALFLDKAIDGRSHAAPASDLGDALRGRDAEVIAPLMPTGTIRIDGRTYEAFCQDGHASLGATVRVIGRDTFRILVTSKLSK